MGLCIFCIYNNIVVDSLGGPCLRQAGEPSHAAHVRRQQAAQGIALASSMTRATSLVAYSVDRGRVAGRLSSFRPSALARRFVILRLWPPWRSSLRKGQTARRWRTPLSLFRVCRYLELGAGAAGPGSLPGKHRFDTSDTPQATRGHSRPRDFSLGRSVYRGSSIYTRATSGVLNDPQWSGTLK